jgi:hypothetical protein
VSLSTGIARQPVLKVQVYYVYQPRVALSRPVVYVPKSVKVPREQVIQLRFYGDGDYNITEINCPSDKIAVEFNEPPPPRVARAHTLAPRVVQPLTLRLPPGEEIPAEGVEIEFLTNDPEFERVTLLVTNNMAQYRKVVGTSRPPVRTVPRSLQQIRPQPGTKPEPKKP